VENLHIFVTNLQTIWNRTFFIQSHVKCRLQVQSVTVENGDCDDMLTVPAVARIGGKQFVSTEWWLVVGR
jgi:hypothetical protein